VLEDALRRKLGKPNLYVFNAAMGGYVSFQEKLAFHLAVAARAPAAVQIAISDESVDLQWWPIDGLPAGSDEALAYLVRCASDVGL